MGVVICVFCVRRLGTWAVCRLSVYKELCLAPWELRSMECVGLQSGFERRRVIGSNLTITYIRAVLAGVRTFVALQIWKYFFIGDFRLPPPCSWCRGPSVRLLGVGWNLVTDVSGLSSHLQSSSSPSRIICLTPLLVLQKLCRL